MGIADDAIIAGIGQTEFSKASGRSELQLAAEAGLAAIEDAGMTPADIDGLVTFTLDSNDELLSDALPGHPRVARTGRAHLMVAPARTRRCSTRRWPCAVARPRRC